MAVYPISTDYPDRGNRWNFLDTEESMKLPWGTVQTLKLRFSGELTAVPRFKHFDKRFCETALSNANRKREYRERIPALIVCTAIGEEVELRKYPLFLLGRGGIIVNDSGEKEGILRAQFGRIDQLWQGNPQKYNSKDQNCP